MNYKTIIMYAVLVGSTQKAWGMEDGAVEQSAVTIKAIYPGTIDLSGLAYLTRDNNRDKIAEARKALDTFRAVLEKADKECPEWAKKEHFKDLVQKMSDFKKAGDNSNPVTMQAMITHDLKAEGLAKELEDALATYQTSNNNNKQE